MSGDRTPEQSVAPLSAGRELDAAVGIAIGAEPTVTWNVLDPTGEVSAYSASYERTARSWIEHTLREYPDSWLKDGYYVGKWEHHEPYSTDPAACAQAKEWLRGRSSTVSVEWKDVAGTFMAEACVHKQGWIRRVAPTEEGAIARLVLAVSEHQKEVGE